MLLGRGRPPIKPPDPMPGRRPDELRPVAASAPGSGNPGAAPVPAPEMHSLGEALVLRGAISATQYHEALNIEREKGGFVGQILVDLGYITQDSIVSFLVKECRIPHLSLLDYDISKDLLNLVPQALCLQHHLLPIDKLGKILTVAMVDPLDAGALQLIRQLCPDLRIKPILCSWQHFVTVTDKLFSEDAKKDDGEVSAEALGLTMMRQPVKKVVAEPSPPSAPIPVAPVAPQPPSVPPPAVSEELIDSAVAEASIQDVVDQLLLETEPPVAGVEPPLIHSPGALDSGFMHMPVAPVSAPGSGLSGVEVAEVFRDALQTTMGTFAAEMRAALELSRPAPADGAGLVEAVQAAVREAVVTMARQAPPVTPVNDARAVQEALAAGTSQLADAVREAVTSVKQAVVDSQAAQEVRMAQLAEAAMRTTQAAQNMMAQTVQVQGSQSHAEAAAVAEANLDDLRKVDREKRAESVASVRPFRHEGASGEGGSGDDRIWEALGSEKPLEKYRFDSFVESKINAFTVKLSQAVANNPGMEYNPFFLYGSVGVGKTHLINAIGNAICDGFPSKRVGYVSASHFARRLTEALEMQALDLFRRNYCHWDVLILDDIQFLGGRVDAQEEFFHIFNVLHQEGRQIIIAADKSPDKLGLMEQRLVSRFAGGIVAELRVPDMEARLGILRHQAQHAQVAIPEEILSMIAMRVPKDVRMMVGALKKMIAFSNLVGQAISYDLANDILSHLGAVEAA